MSKRGVLGTGQARKGGGVLGTGQVKKGGGGLYCGTYVHWTYMRVPTPRAWTIMIIFYIKPMSECYQYICNDLS